MLVKTFTPTEPLMQRMEDRIYASPSMWNLLVKYVVMEANTQFKYVFVRETLTTFLPPAHSSEYVRSRALPE